MTHEQYYAGAAIIDDIKTTKDKLDDYSKSDSYYKKYVMIFYAEITKKQFDKLDGEIG